MQCLHAFPLKEPRAVQKHRRAVQSAPADPDLRIALGIALAEAGCSYEAASIMRPLRSHWKSSARARVAQEAIDAQAWWNKNWRRFVQLRHSGKTDAALALLGDRVEHYWDLPPLLMHLGQIAADDDRPDLASHLFQRVAGLAKQGLPNKNMEAFAYVAQSALIDLLRKTGNAAAALEQHRVTKPNPGNAMAHGIQHAALLVAAGHLDAAMRQVASMLVTARKHRTGYSKAICTDFIAHAPELAPLRRRQDWEILLRDPVAHLRGAKLA